MISVFLARLLSPADFGIVGMATVFITFTQGFADLGLSSGLIRTKEPTETQYSSVFFFNLGVSLLLALALFSSAGLIASYYNNPEVKPIVRFISYSFIINALTTVHWAIFYKNLEVKIIRSSSIASALVSGPAGIALAYLGYGVWSIVYSGFIGSVTSVLIIWSYSKWRPKLVFRFSEIRQLFPFGIRVFFINYLQEVYERIDVLIIGKIFQPAVLGQYFRASSFNQLITKYSSQGLSGVFFPVISKIQDNHEEIRRVFSKTLHTICFLSFMLSGLLFVNAEPLIVLLFSSKWYPAVHYFQILAFSSYVFPMTIIFNGVLLGTGNSGKQLNLELIKKGLGLTGLCIGFLFGLEGYLWSLVVTATLGLSLSLYFIDKAISLPVKKSLGYIYSYALPLFAAGIPATLAGKFIFETLWLKLLADSIIFFMIYLVLTHVLKMAGYQATRKLATEFITNRISPLLRRKQSLQN